MVGGEVVKKKAEIRRHGRFGWLCGFQCFTCLYSFSTLDWLCDLRGVTEAEI